MFAVLSSSDVWPTVIHFKRLAWVALSLSLSLSCSDSHSLSHPLCFSAELQRGWYPLLLDSCIPLSSICELFYFSLFALLCGFPSLSSLCHCHRSPPPPSSLLPPPPPRLLFLYVLAIGWACVLGDDEIWSPMLDDPHLISLVRQILKQVNFSVLRGKDTLLHFFFLQHRLSWH